MGVQRDDVVVGQLLLADPGGPAILEVDVELGRSSPPGPLSRAVGPGTDPAGLRQALDLVGRLGGPEIVQRGDERRRVRLAEAGPGRLWLAQQGPSPAGRHRRARVGGAAHDAQLELPRPRCLGRRRRQVPVVRLLPEQQQWLAARLEGQQAARGRPRDPLLEGRVGLVGIGHVVGELHGRLARGDQQSVEPGLAEGLRSPFGHHGEVGGE